MKRDGNRIWWIKVIPDMMLSMKLLVVLFAFAVTTTVAAQTVIDGDTVRLGGVTYRLWGIDAPELQQVCQDGWPAGKEAALMLRSIIERGLDCEPKTRDRYGRTVAICRAGGEDVGAIMVREGLAWAFERYSHDYVGQQALAAAEGRGVHAHGCEVPWEWRQRKRSAAQPMP